MKTPAEHYRAADRLLKNADKLAEKAQEGGLLPQQIARINLSLPIIGALAQAHATLALAPYDTYADATGVK